MGGGVGWGSSVDGFDSEFLMDSVVFGGDPEGSFEGSCGQDPRSAFWLLVSGIVFKSGAVRDG